MIRLTLFALTVVSISASNDLEKPDMDIVLKAVGAPPCMRECIDPFMEKLTGIWNMEDVVDRMKDICASHDEALACLSNKQFCDLQNIFSVASSSVSYRCKKQEMLFKTIEPCLRKNFDFVTKKCDARCQGRSSLTNFTSNPSVKLAAAVGGNMFIVSDHLGDMCGSLSCLLRCATEELNAVCTNGGWIILDTLLQPLETVASMMGSMSPGLRDLIRTKLDKRCHFILEQNVLQNIRGGDFDAIY